MTEYADILKFLRSERASQRFLELYGHREGMLLYQMERYIRLVKKHKELFGGEKEIRIFSAPGRTEIGGNHTDHNHGKVLAAAVTLDSVAVVSKNDKNVVTLHSDGYARPFVVDLSDLSMREKERESTYSLIRGVAARMKELGFSIGGFDAVVGSNVLKGSGLSSSAAFEVLFCAIFDGLYNSFEMDGKLRAQISQYAENEYFGKPCGLMDQMASSMGGLVTIDFKRGEANVTQVSYDFAEKGYALAVVAAGGNHANLTEAYASIPREMHSVAAHFGAKTLREVFAEQVEKDLPTLRQKVSDRAILRALHYFDENKRVCDMVKALDGDDLPAFLSLITASGESSWKLLQNIHVDGSAEQELSLALEMSRRTLGARGAWRVHGGGFAGTILAFVPQDLLPGYVAQMDAVFGDHATTVLDIRPAGAAEFVIPAEG